MATATSDAAATQAAWARIPKTHRAAIARLHHARATMTPEQVQEAQRLEAYYGWRRPDWDLSGGAA